jgi:hypothetical protein
LGEAIKWRGSFIHRFHRFTQIICGFVSVAHKILPQKAKKGTGHKVVMEQSVIVHRAKLVKPERFDPLSDEDIAFSNALGLASAKMTLK